MVFAIIAIVTTVGYVTFSLNVLDSFNQSILTRNQITLDVTKEKFDLYSVKMANNKFNATISNSGNLPINITRMWVQNTSATDWVNYYPINTLIPPGTLWTNIGQSSPVSYVLAKAYNLKLITGRGNSMQFTLGGLKPVFMQLEMLPTTVHTNSLVTGNNNNNATALLAVVNNMTSSSNLLTNLTPNFSCRGYGGPPVMTWQVKATPIPSQYPYLPNGGTAFFKWTVLVKNATNTGNNHVTCTANLQNGVVGNNGTDTVWAVP